MTASLVLMTSAWLAGADCAACAAPAPAPVVAAPCVGCANEDPCPGEEKPGFLAKLKGVFSGHKSKGCETCAPPVFAGFTTACSDPCADSEKQGLFSRLKAKFHKGDACSTPACASCPPIDSCATPAPAATGCALPATPGTAPAAPAVPAPQVMPSDPKAPVMEKKASYFTVPEAPAIAPVSATPSTGAPILLTPASKF